MDKPFSPSCERNQEFILEVLKKYLVNAKGNLFEIASGTGQHAVYLSRYFPEINWFCSDLKDKHDGIKIWLDEELKNRELNKQVQNLKQIFHYEVMNTPFPKGDFNFLFTANSFHIMSWEHVQYLIREAGQNLKKDSLFFIYGPFNYNGEFSSESNAKFELWLKARNPLSGIRDFEKVCETMNQSGFSLLADHEMPANNRILVFEK